MRIHESMSSSTIGRRDSYGYGGGSAVLWWPSLPGQPTCVSRSTTGSCHFPAMPGEVRNLDTGELAAWSIYGWDHSGGSEAIIASVTEDGTAYVPLTLLGGQRVIVECPCEDTHRALAAINAHHERPRGADGLPLGGWELNQHLCRAEEAQRKTIAEMESVPC